MPKTRVLSTACLRLAALVFASAEITSLGLAAALASHVGLFFVQTLSFLVFVAFGFARFGCAVEVSRVLVVCGWQVAARAFVCGGGSLPTV